VPALSSLVRHRKQQKGQVDILSYITGIELFVDDGMAQV
jgi:hypothetical protein